MFDPIKNEQLKKTENRSQININTCVSTARFSAEQREFPIKFKENAELSIPDVEVFYSCGIKGYTDYPFLEKALAI